MKVKLRLLWNFQLPHKHNSEYQNGHKIQRILLSIAIKWKLPTLQQSPKLLGYFSIPCQGVPFQAKYNVLTHMSVAISLGL